MRKSVSLLVLGLLMGTVGCELSTGEEDDDVTGKGRNGGDAGDRGTSVAPSNGSGGADAGSTTVDASAATPDANAPASDAATPTTTNDAATPSATHVSVPHEQCVATLASASTTCGGADIFEPNDEKATATPLDTGTGCAFVPGKLSSYRDADFYSFSSELADPVRVHLGYETTPTGGSNLNLEITDAIGSQVAYIGGDRQDLTWFLDARFVAKKGVQYTARIGDRASGGCQGYNLRVDTKYCTDAFEDNDTKAAATKGLEYGKTLTATVFYSDDDFYDLTAIQAGGANCVVTTDIELTSTEKLTFEATTGPGSQVAYRTLSPTDGTNTVTIPLRAASGATTLRITSDTKTCTNYTLVCNPL